MVSDKVYKESLDELKSVRKTLAYSNVSINMDRLDPESKKRITEALASICNIRIGDISSNVLAGVKY